MTDIKETTGKISALEALDTKLNDAIRDEEEAQRIYDSMMQQIDKVANTYSGVYSNEIRTYSKDLREIRDQERAHVRKLMIHKRNLASLRGQEITKLDHEKRRIEDEHRNEEKRLRLLNIAKEQRRR
jgi:hypothetical protein